MNWKLAAGRLRDAWRELPRQRREFLDFPAGPPIFVGGTHRSGTTWVAKMLAEPGLWYIHEPFNPNKRIWKQAFSYAPPERNRPDIDQYFSKLLGGKFRSTSNSPNTDHWLMPMRLFCPPIQRVIIKDPLACLLTGYLNRHFELKSIILFRHPAGFVSSITRLRWPVGIFLKDFLRRTDLMNDHLSPYAELMEKHQDRDDAPAAAVLHGALNSVQWNQIQLDSRIRWYLFEDLCRDPLTSFANIFADFRIPYTEATRHRHSELSFQGSPNSDDYHAHAVARKSSAMADSWKRQLSAEHVAQVRDIWQRFDIPLYHDDASWVIGQTRQIPT